MAPSRADSAARPTPQDGTTIPSTAGSRRWTALALELTAAYAGMQRLGVESVLQEGNMMGLTAAFRADRKRVLLKRASVHLEDGETTAAAVLGMPGSPSGATCPCAGALAVGQTMLAKRAPDPPGALLRLGSEALVEASRGGSADEMLEGAVEPRPQWKGQSGGKIR